MRSKKTVLVCGATGFIGRNICKTLSQNQEYKVVGVYNKRPKYESPEIDWIKADLTIQSEVDKALKGVDIIVQAAATTSGSKDIVLRPYIHVTDNAVMNSLIFRAAFEQEVQHVLFFSCTVMLESSPEPQTEEAYDANTELHPRYFGVGNTKLYIEKMCDFYSKLGETKYTAVRHTNIYGPHDKFDLEKSHVFGASITKVLSAEEGSSISVWGTGEEERDLLYVDDLTDFVLRAINKQKSKYSLYNCGYGSAISIRDLVRKIISISNKKINIEHDLSQPTIMTSLSLNCNKAKRELGWQPKIRLEKGIEQTISWWKENIEEQ